MKQPLRILFLAALLWLSSSCASADRDFRSRVESVSLNAGESRTDPDGTTTTGSAGATIHLRDPNRGLAK